MPIMSLWLGITLLEAFFLDLGFAIFYLIYAFVYNLSYDKIFPFPAKCRTACRKVPAKARIGWTGTKK